MARYEQIVRRARWAAIAAALTFGSLFIIEEASNPALYLLMFILFQISMFAMIALVIYQARYKKKHTIHHHGD